MYNISICFSDDTTLDIPDVKKVSYQSSNAGFIEGDELLAGKIPLNGHVQFYSESSTYSVILANVRCLVVSKN